MFRVIVALVMCAAVSGFTLAPVTPAASLVSSPSAARIETITMGRGDKRTAKGKRKAGSFGKSRPRNAELRKRKAAAAEGSSE